MANYLDLLEKDYFGLAYFDEGMVVSDSNMFSVVYTHESENVVLFHDFIYTLVRRKNKLFSIYVYTVVVHNYTIIAW